MLADRLKRLLYRGLLLKMFRARSGGLSPAPRTVAVWQFGGIGDMIIGAAVVRDIAKRYPQASIDLYCSNPAVSSFVTELGTQVRGIHLYDAYAVDSRSMLGRKARRHFFAVLRQHRENSYDLLVNLHIPKLLDWWFFELVLMRWSGAKCLAGFVPEATRPGLLDCQWATQVVEQRHYLSLYRDLLAPLGIPIHGRGYFPSGKVKRLRNLVVLHPGASKLFKRWPVERFTELAERLQARGYMVTIVGDRQELPIGESMASSLPGLVNEVGRLDLREMANLLASACLFVGNDSAPFHMAVAVGTPSLGIFGAGPPMYSEYPVKDVRVLRVPLPCAPCFRNACGHHMECMSMLAVDTVWEGVLGLLQHQGEERHARG